MTLQLLRPVFLSARNKPSFVAQSSRLYHHDDSNDKRQKIDVWPYYQIDPPINPGPNKHIPFKVQTLDDLPEPKGDWKSYYDRKQRTYLRHLVMGVSAFSFTMYMVFGKGFIWFNAVPPPMPPKEERIKTFWVPPADD